MSKIIKIVNEFRLLGADRVAFNNPKSVVEVLKAADDLYYNDAESFLSDAEYDQLRKSLENHHPNLPYFQGVGSEVRGGKIDLPFTMGSLTQAYDGDMERWVEKNNAEDEWFIVSDKIDGVSVMLAYGEDGNLQIAYSRGDGVQGADITRHIRKLSSVPKSVKIANLVVRGEVVIPKDNFEQIKTKVNSRSGRPYKNARNMVAGLMNAEKNPSIVYENLMFFAYEITSRSAEEKSSQLNELKVIHKFTAPWWEPIKGKNLTTSGLSYLLNARRAATPYDIDGLVVEAQSEKLRRQLVPTKDTLNPEYARKFKVADASNLAIATVLEVEWNLSKDGYLKPRVRVEPVELVGVTVQHATGFNAKFIAENGIGPGAKVKITRAGDVVPFIQEVVKSVAPQMPDADAEWTSTGVDLVLKDAHSNETVQFESLRDFFATLDVPALKEGNVKALFDAGFTTPESIITMTEGEVCSVIGKAIGKKIFAGLRAKMTNIPVYELMGAHPAFGRGVGVRKMKKLYEAFAGDMSECANVPSIIAVEGFDHKTAMKVANGYKKYIEFLAQTAKYITFAPYKAPMVGGLSGSVFVFTGFRSKELEEKIVERGGKMGSAVSSKTTYLVAESKDSTSGKATKARELGIKVISQDDLKKMLGM